MALFIRVVVAFAIVTFLATGAYGQTTWFVDDDNCPGPGTGTQADPFCMIQDGMDAAVNGDEVLVAPGTYNEKINFNGKAITLRSSDGAAVTTIDGTGLMNHESVVKCVSGEGPDTVLDGLTITGGNAFGGGGMFISGSSPTVTNCTFTGNSSAVSAGGGGIINISGDGLTVSNCTFTQNIAFEGGGIFNIQSDGVTVSNCTFSGNGSLLQGQGDGGGISNFQSDRTTVTNCTFSGNNAMHEGGGMCNSQSDGVTVSNCTFTQNIAVKGSAIANSQSRGTTVSNCTFTANSTIHQGGGMYNSQSDGVTVSNCTFTQNIAVEGSAIANVQSRGMTVSNCSFRGTTRCTKAAGCVTSRAVGRP